MSDQALQELGDYITSALGKDALSAEVNRVGELVVRVERRSIVRVLQFLRDDSTCLFQQLMELCGVDYPQRSERFEVVYCLLSLKHNQRVRVVVTTDEDTPVPSVTGVFPVANWFEREAWDLYGIFFSDHPDLRRILTDYGFEGHPLRKDFPLTGYVELRYDPDQRRVVYEPVKLTQDFRSFDFLSPWEGMTEVQLPGDEKAAIPLGAVNPVQRPIAGTPSARDVATNNPAAGSVKS
ncbi:NADH-quinone oxidoreductase subunit C [Rhodospirillum centenum]|uniref:NADH-quinone oxidoreductase subunit C n=1 Tax=Rhodospirillum centenum (strain ATCC 51521 / SW) TaxID=414684 RepID=B6ISX9_RHOCS|nr:NADH-quinone oxidoreductase subunit C [Rhodospirillum centenum]ACI98650.1 NADH-quinone oxidoreductase chain C [Rhodospirillum centenum SW]